MIKDDITVWSCGRLSSERCKDKMVRDFANTSLTDIFLEKLATLNLKSFFAGYEEIFREKCKHHGVNFVKRTKKSSEVDFPASEIYNFLNQVDTKYFLQINACIPMLKTETINKFIDECIKNNKPKFAVFKKNNYFMDNDFRPLNYDNSITTINTKSVSSVHEFAHIFYFFDKSYFEKNGWFWDWRELEYITIPQGIETFDIDTEEEFKIAEALYLSNHNR